MSHIAEVYAKDLGVKIGRPHITDHFFPGLPDKYITVQSSSKMPAARYKYWDIVLGLIKPHLNDIKIIQVGGPEEEKIKGADHYYLGTSYKQMNYMIKKASTHVGCDSLPGHIAGAYDVPCVILHFNLYPENSKPLWHKKNKSISLSPDFSEVKPSFSTTCNRINEIKPETIAQSVLDQLNIKSKINFNTLRIGDLFQNNTIEIVPNFFIEHQDFISKVEKFNSFVESNNVLLYERLHALGVPSTDYEIECYINILNECTGNSTEFNLDDLDNQKNMFLIFLYQL